VFLVTALQPGNLQTNRVTVNQCLSMFQANFISCLTLKLLGTLHGSFCFGLIDLVGMIGFVY
jgi:hypothetical protein